MLHFARHLDSLFSLLSIFVLWFIQFYTEGEAFSGVGVINHILHQPNLHSLTVPSTIVLIDFLNIFLHLCSYIYNDSLCRCYWIGWKDMDHFWNGWDTFTLIFISSFPGNIQRHTSMLIYCNQCNVVDRHEAFELPLEKLEWNSGGRGWW